ncbi:MAG: DNA-binding transcriptional regulator CytR [Anaerolineae bacterium]
MLQAVQQLGYRPNVYARSLRGQKTRMIAMMIADIANSFYHPMVRAVQDIARQHGYDVMVANTDHQRESEEHFCEAIIRRPVDGVVVVPYHLTAEELGYLMQRTGAYISCLGQHIEHHDIDVVYGNDGEATYDAIRWLIQERGHQRIAFIGVNILFSAGTRRYENYVRAMREAGLEIPPEYVIRGDWSFESGQEAMRAFLSLPKPPTAVFACNDVMAIGAILAAQELGARVPEDIAVVGFDNIPAGTWIRPHLTTVAQYPKEIGEKLATMLFERIEGEYNGPGRRFEIPCRFIPRESA